jgi:hypothetical protein
MDKGHDGQPHLKGKIWKSTNATKVSKARQKGLKRRIKDSDVRVIPE